MERTTRWFRLFILLTSILQGVPTHAAAFQTPFPADEIILRDDFENPATSLFQPEELYGYRVALELGAMQMEFPHVFPGAYVSIDLPTAARDGTVRIDSRLVDGSSDQYVAVGCRGSLNTFNAGYTFVVSPYDGFVALYRREQGVKVLLNSMYLSAAKGDDSVQTVGLTCRGTTLTGHVNGQEVLDATDDRFADGYFYIETGFFGNSAAEERLSAVVDNLVVDVPSEEGVRLRALSDHASDELDVLIKTRTEPALVGPVGYELQLQGEAGMYVSQDVGVDVEDFYAAVQFHSPLDADASPWDGVFLFRVDPVGNGYLVVVSSAGFWEVMDASGAYLAKGTFSGFDGAADSSITVEVAAAGDRGYVRINGSTAVEIRLADGSESGAIEVGSGMIPGNNRRGESVYCSKLVVFELVADRHLFTSLSNGG